MRRLRSLALTVLAAAGPGCGSSSADLGGADGGISGSDGSSGVWTTVNGPSTNDLRAVWGSSPTDVWVVGYGGVILHLQGSSWSASNSRPTGGFAGIWGSSATDVWAVDLADTILHWQGSSWAQVASPTNLGDERDLGKLAERRLGRRHRQRQQCEDLALAGQFLVRGRECDRTLALERVGQLAE
jgi:hypothetical protein